MELSRYLNRIHKYEQTVHLNSLKRDLANVCVEFFDEIDQHSYEYTQNSDEFRKDDKLVMQDSQLQLNSCQQSNDKSSFLISCKVVTTSLIPRMSRINYTVAVSLPQLKESSNPTSSSRSSTLEFNPASQPQASVPERSSGRQLRSGTKNPRLPQSMMRTLSYPLTT